MRVIEKKIHKSFADAVYSGEKTFEIRENDEGYQKGDIIKFKVVDDEWPFDFEINHSLNGKEYLITYVISGWGLKEGFVVLSITPVPSEDIKEF